MEQHYEMTVQLIVIDDRVIDVVAGLEAGLELLAEYGVARRSGPLVLQEMVPCTTCPYSHPAA